MHSNWHARVKEHTGKYDTGELGNQGEYKYTQDFLKHPDKQQWVSNCEKKINNQQELSKTRKYNRW